MEALREPEVKYPPEIVLVGDKEISYKEWEERFLASQRGTSEEQQPIVEAIKDDGSWIHF